MNSSERSLLVFVLIDRRDHLEDSLKTIYSKTASVFFVFLVTVDDKNLSDVIRVIFEEDNYCILYIHKEEIKERILFFASQNDYEFAMFLRGGDVIANKNFLDNTIYFFKEYKANCSLFQGGVIKGKYVKDTSLLIFTKSSKFFDKKTFYEEVFFEKEFQLPELFDGFTFNISFLLQFLNREEVNENLIFNLFKTEELYILFAPVLYRRYSQEHVASNIRKLGTFLKQQIDLSQVMRLGFCQLLKDTLKSASTNDYSKLGKIVKEASAKTLLSQESRKKRLFLNLLNFPLFYPLLTYYIGLRKKGNIELKHSSSYIEFIILDFGIKEKEKNILRASVSSSDCSTLTFINVKDRFIDFKEVRYLTRAMYGRFLIPQLFPSEEKVIYSDVDVVFKSDIRDLFETDLQGKILGACPEIFDDNNGCNQKKKERLELGFAHEYFSSGLLLINSRLWNESGIQKRIEEAYRQKKEVLICPDQDLLNVVFCNNYKKINNKWCVVNQLIESYTSPYFFFFSKLDGVGIRHFNGKNKPWKRSPSLFEKAVEVGTLEYWRYLLSSDLLKENLFYSKLSFSKKMQLNIVLRLSYLFC